MTKTSDLGVNLAAAIACIFFVYFIGVTHLKYDPIWGRRISFAVPRRATLGGRLAQRP